MKLLFDQNLSLRLVRLLAAEFPGSQHVRDVGLAIAPDPAIWAYAAAQGMVIVSKDSDF
jgi:predicted nuclease of predicted toxin-antitoxin system